MCTYLLLLGEERGTQRTVRPGWVLGFFFRLMCWFTDCCVKMGQSEPAPTSAPMRMDGVLMGAPFSSLSVPGLTKVANSSWPYFFPFLKLRLVFVLGFFFSVAPHACPGPTYLPTFRLLHMHSGLLPPPTYPPIYLPSHQPIYLCNYALNLHRGNDDAG